MSGTSAQLQDLSLEEANIPKEIPPVEPAMESPYSIQLNFFSGPMDLLLHLVARQEVPIEEVSMAKVAEQYLEVVSNEAERLDLEQASEFLVIAATLMAIKSRSLLPVESSEEEEELGEWNDDNPFFQDLRERLKAYRVTQARAKALRLTPQLGVHTFSRRDRKALLPTPEMLAEPEDVFSLGTMFGHLLKRIGKSAGYTIAAQPVSVVTFMVRIVDSLSERVRTMVEVGMPTRIGFFELLATLAPKSDAGGKHGAISDKEPEPRMRVIGGFVAVLELMKRGLLKADVQEEGFSVELQMDISQDIAVEELDSEFDSIPEQQLEPEQQSEAAPSGSEEKVVHMDQYRERKAG